MHTSNIFVTVDAVVFRKTNHQNMVLLIQRKNEPFKNAWALPGGFVDENEDLESAAKRELTEETGVIIDKMQQLSAFGKPDRDPRQRTISIAFLAFADESHNPVAADDAADAGWFPVEKLPKLAFDHLQIINLALTKI